MDNLVHITQYVRLGIILAACQPATVCEVLQYDERENPAISLVFCQTPLRFGLFSEGKKTIPISFWRLNQLVHPCANLVIHLTSGADGG